MYDHRSVFFHMSLDCLGPFSSDFSDHLLDLNSFKMNKKCVKTERILQRHCRFYIGETCSFHTVSTVFVRSVRFIN